MILNFALEMEFFAPHSSIDDSGIYFAAIPGNYQSSLPMLNIIP
jgi:hypothetical protein